MNKPRDAVIHNPDDVISDGVLQKRSKYVPHEDKLYTEIVQPSRDIILNRNKELQNNPGVINDLSFGRLALTIPEADYWDLKAKYPGLAHPDLRQRRKHWEKFLASPESKPYRVQG